MRVSSWVEALRSGKFSQTKYAMYDGTGFCCLGVAEVVCLNETFIPIYPEAQTMYRDSIGGIEQPEETNENLLNLNTPVTPSEREQIREYLDSIGIKQIPFPLSPSRTSVLANINDETDAGFRAIADIIEMLGWDVQANISQPENV